MKKIAAIVLRASVDDIEFEHERSISERGTNQ